VTIHSGINKRRLSTLRVEFATAHSATAITHIQDESIAKSNRDERRIQEMYEERAIRQQEKEKKEKNCERRQAEE
jgi:hypothetical protein